MTNVVPKDHPKKTPITEMLNLNESIRKEKTHFKIYENFTINPANLMVYPEKPNLMKPLPVGVSSATLQSSAGLRESTVDLDEETKSKLSRYTFVPKQKYAYPQTESQELGWFDGNGQFSGSRKAKNSCAETKYANDYFSMTHLSPYSKKNK